MNHALKYTDPWGTMSMKYIDEGNEYLTEFIKAYATRLENIEPKK
jgi:hypothetical protein